MLSELQGLSAKTQSLFSAGHVLNVTFQYRTRVHEVNASAMLAQSNAVTFLKGN